MLGEEPHNGRRHHARGSDLTHQQTITVFLFEYSQWEEHGGLGAVASLVGADSSQALRGIEFRHHHNGGTTHITELRIGTD